ncbi:hypothetical protein B296_00006036 [Ensete ventricosum]|uniref:Uncharacterized protein n=1 Tax=Ensete ventricosum TaxID=4639 RepID=A0A426ZL67_ENSVE|nr:hypothetical protein B296_00006036 [Ensete ventricosum]
MGALQLAPFASAALQALPPLRAGHNRSCPRAAALLPTGVDPRSSYRPLRVPLASLSGWHWPQPATPLQGALVAAWPGREENRSGRLQLQPINYESPLLFIESHQKP